jgi:hypothetical protein
MDDKKWMGIYHRNEWNLRLILLGILIVFYLGRYYGWREMALAVGEMEDAKEEMGHSTT